MKQDISFTEEELKELAGAEIDVENLTDSTIQYLHETHQSKKQIEIKALEKIFPVIYANSSPLSLFIPSITAKEFGISEKITILASVPNHLWYLSALGCTYAADILVKLHPLELKEAQERKNTFSFTINASRRRTLFGDRAVTVSRSGLVLLGLLQMTNNLFHESQHLRAMLRLMSESPTTLKEKAFAISEGHWQISYDKLSFYEEDEDKNIENKSSDAKEIKNFAPLEVLLWVKKVNKDEIYNRHLQHITNWLVAFGAVIPNELIHSTNLSKRIDHIPSISYESKSANLVHAPSTALSGEGIELALFYRFHFDPVWGKNIISNIFIKLPIFYIPSIFPEIINHIILQYLLEFKLPRAMPIVESHFNIKSQEKIRAALTPYIDNIDGMDTKTVEALSTGDYFKIATVFDAGSYRPSYPSTLPFQQSFLEPLQPAAFGFMDALKQWLLDFSSDPNWPVQKQNLAEFLWGPRYHHNEMDVTYSADFFLKQPGISEKIRKGLHNIKAALLSSDQLDASTLIQAVMDFINQHQRWQRLIMEAKLPSDYDLYHQLTISENEDKLISSCLSSLPDQKISPPSSLTLSFLLLEKSSPKVNTMQVRSQDLLWFLAGKGSSYVLNWIEHFKAIEGDPTKLSIDVAANIKLSQVGLFIMGLLDPESSFHTETHLLKMHHLIRSLPINFNNPIAIISSQTIYLPALLQLFTHLIPKHQFSHAHNWLAVYTGELLTYPKFFKKEKFLTDYPTSTYKEKKVVKTTISYCPMGPIEEAGAALKFYWRNTGVILITTYGLNILGLSAPNQFTISIINIILNYHGNEGLICLTNELNELKEDRVEDLKIIPTNGFGEYSEKMLAFIEKFPFVKKLTEHAEPYLKKNNSFYSVPDEKYRYGIAIKRWLIELCDIINLNKPGKYSNYEMSEIKSLFKRTPPPDSSLSGNQQFGVKCNYEHLALLIDGHLYSAQNPETTEFSTRQGESCIMS
jgi:hypothetical protein